MNFLSAKRLVLSSTYFAELPMKALLLACVPLALAGCSSSPGEGDIEAYLNPLFATCKNIELADISKTNGYGDANNYEVEFNYRIDVDADKLDKLHAVYLKEKALSDQFSVNVKTYEQSKRVLEEVVERHRMEFQRANPAPLMSQFSTTGSGYLLEPAQREEFHAAENSWKAQRDEGIAQQVAELQGLNQAWNASRASAQNKRFENTARIGNEINAFYEQGCTWPAPKFMVGILGQDRIEDQAQWFERRSIEMSGKLAMRKTENGWRVTEGG